jgi:hypothetical protein
MWLLYGGLRRKSSMVVESHEYIQQTRITCIMELKGTLPVFCEMQHKVGVNNGV